MGVYARGRGKFRDEDERYDALRAAQRRARAIAWSAWQLEVLSAPGASSPIALAAGTSLASCPSPWQHRPRCRCLS